MFMGFLAYFTKKDKRSDLLYRIFTLNNSYQEHNNRNNQQDVYKRTKYMKSDKSYEP